MIISAQRSVQNRACQTGCVGLWPHSGQPRDWLFGCGNSCLDTWYCSLSCVISVSCPGPLLFHQCSVPLSCCMQCLTLLQFSFLGPELPSSLLHLPLANLPLRRIFYLSICLVINWKTTTTKKPYLYLILVFSFSFHFVILVIQFEW